MRKDTQIQAFNSLLAFREQGAKPKQGQTTILDTSYYVVGNLLGSGFQKLITPTTKRELGKTNFEGNKLNAGKFFVIDGVKITVGYVLPDGKISAFTSYNVFSIVNDLCDSELVIKQGERTLIRLSIHEIADVTELDYFRSFSTLPVIAPNEPFEITLEHKNGADFSLKTSMVRVDLRGHEFKLV